MHKLGIFYSFIIALTCLTVSCSNYNSSKFDTEQTMQEKCKNLSGLNDLVQNLFFTTTGDTTSMSMFGIMVVVFAGIGLAIGLSRLVVQWLGSLGGSKM